MGSDNRRGNFLASNLPYCSDGDVGASIYNITAPYTDDTNKASIIGTSITMFTLSMLFFNLTMFRQIGPSIRVARSAAISLFLPIMSYLFSEAKNAAGAIVATSTIVTEIMPLELPARARLILTWMLLVELLRKKTEAVWVPKMGYTSTSEQAARITWLGSLVFSNIKSPGRRAVFGVIWAVAVAKMAQRFVINQVIRRSFSAGRNPEIIGAYTQKIPMPRCCNSCEFAVMGEENIERRTGPNGYVLVIPQGTNLDSVITIRKIWREGELPKEAKNLCLSFALHKLLRRRFEGPTGGDYPNYDMETQACKALVDKLCRCHDHDERRRNDELFCVIADEVKFLCECYHSFEPVVLASPFFLVANYFLFPAAVGCVCLLTVVAGGYGDVRGTFYSIRTDNYVLSFDVVKTVVCLLRKVLFSPPALLSAVELCITFFLFVAYFYEELSEFFVFLFSNWFVVSLVCSYVKAAGKSSYRCVIASSIRCILFVRRWFTERENVLHLRQLNLTRTAFFWMPATLRRSPLPAAAKDSLIKHLTDCISKGGMVTLGNSTAWQYTAHQSSECGDQQSIAQVILTWYIATTILQAKHQQPNGAADGDQSRIAAITLSRYCAYLVAFRPEILPNDWNDTQHVYRTMVWDLTRRLGFWGNYCFLPKRTWLERMGRTVSVAGNGKKEGSAVEEGVALAAALESAMSNDSEESIWKALTELWVELIVYIAPAMSEEANLQGHYAALLEGGEFITLLWALTTHCGVKRPIVTSTAGA